MSSYTIKPLLIKSAIEIETFTKDNSCIVVENIYHFGSYRVETTNHKKPELDLNNKEGIQPEWLFEEIENIEERNQRPHLCDIYWFNLIDENETLTEKEIKRIHKNCHLKLLRKELPINFLESEGYSYSDRIVEFRGPLVLENKKGEEIARGTI